VALLDTGQQRKDDAQYANRLFHVVVTVKHARYPVLNVYQSNIL